MKRTIIAAAVLATASGAAFAHHIADPYIFNSTAVSENMDIDGSVRLFGHVSVSSTVGAVVDNTQAVSVNATLDPPPQTYTVGTVTKTIDVGSQSSTENGYKFSASVSTESGSKSFSESAQASSSYGYHNEKSAVSGGGYAYDKQSSSSSNSTSHTGEDSAAYAALSVNSSDSYTYAHHNGRHSGSGSKTDMDSVTVNAATAGYQDTSSSASASSSAKGSGDHVKWSFSANQGSGAKWSKEQASSSAQWSETNKKGYAAVWGSGESKSWKNVETQGSVTTYIDTQKPGELNAMTGTGSGNGASGNIGINVAEGIDNAQSNDTSLASVDAGNVFGNAQIFNNQSSGGTAQINNFALNASVGDFSLQNVSGNVGVNVSAGVGNVQNNSLAASTTNLNPGSASAVAMAATDQNSQSAAMSFNGTFQGTASLGAGALQNSMGNIGVNIAGGAGNLQHNGLAIAATNMSH
ncbi:hypothetical protein [Trinickia fusca]|uniref:Cell wall anchor protein n=1 Tax=Trinickia fusca TaxID=2419777 RepID=A0A494XMU5_9BURK|nr:hypothetical protein [Trinickia fusca]RKP52010.1 hypothetical protein D7S89_00110 [Trinickia fusca]